MLNVMAAQPNIGGALCESSVIQFPVPRGKVWLTAAARVPLSNATLGRKVNFAAGKILLGGKSSQKCIIVYQLRRWKIVQSFVGLR